MNKVKSGDLLRIPAATFNTFVDSARDYLQRQQGTGGRPTQTFRQTGIVPVKNNSGADRGRFAVLGIDSPIFTPSEVADTFANQVALVGVTPSASSHSGKFALLLEPVADGEIGMGCVDGVCPAVVNVTDAAHEYADTNDGTTILASCRSGAAQILWRESGTGLKWAIVRIGVSLPETLFPAQVTVDGGSAGGPTADCSFTYTVKDLDGNVLATALTPQVPRLTNVECLQPAENSPGLAYLDAAEAVKLYHVAGIDGVNNKFQVKYRYVRVLEAEDEDAAWSDVHTGTECPS